MWLIFLNFLKTNTRKIYENYNLLKFFYNCTMGVMTRNMNLLHVVSKLGYNQFFGSNLYWARAIVSNFQRNDLLPLEKQEVCY